MRLTDIQSSEIAKMTSTREDLNRLNSPTGEVLVAVVVEAKDYGIEAPKPLVFVIVNESTFLYGEAYTVDSIEQGEANSADRLEHIAEAWGTDF